MTAKERVNILGPVFIASGVLTAMAGGDFGSWISGILRAGSIILFLFGLWQLLQIVLEGKEGTKLKGFLPLCRERVFFVFKLCARCVGMHSGLLVSIFLVVLAHQTPDLFQSLFEVNPWLLLGLSLLLGMPTVWHGARRRLGKYDPFPSWAALFMTGFLAGIAWFLSFSAFHQFLAD